MRVHLLRLPANLRRPALGRADGERGAIAVVAGLLMLAFLGLGAFSVDLGMSFADTRRLQTSADAAALAAANVLRGTAGTCTTILGASQTAAGATADLIREQNRTSSTRATYTASCTADGSLQVTYASRGSTPSFFGGAFGRSGDYTTTRTATARLSTLGNGKIRPYAVCGAQLSEASFGTVLQMDLPSSGNTQCPGVANPGNWWSVDCPEVASNSNAYMATATLDGCTSDVVPVSGQLTAPPRTPSDLRSYLISSCAVRSTSCLSANTGQIGGVVLTSWNVLVAEQRRVIFPVFCGGTPPGPCDTGAVVNAGGNNAIYPVQALVGVQVCGYHFGNQKSPNGTGVLTGECASHNPGGLTTSTGGSQDNYILMRLVDIPTLPKGGASTCPLGAPCDLQRTVSLIQ
ncbi:pilus assembly protein TadG-related protein [Pedococcus soli]